MLKIFLDNAPYILGVFPIIVHPKEIEQKFSYCLTLQLIEYSDMDRPSV